MKKIKNFYQVIIFVGVLISWFFGIAFYDENNINTLGWFMYIIPLIVGIYFSLNKFSRIGYILTFFSAITPLFEIFWSNIFGLNFSEIVNPDYIDLCFNFYGIAGYIVLVIIPLGIIRAIN